MRAARSKYKPKVACAPPDRPCPRTQHTVCASSRSARRRRRSLAPEPACRAAAAAAIAARAASGSAAASLGIVAAAAAACCEAAPCRDWSGAAKAAARKLALRPGLPAVHMVVIAQRGGSAALPPDCEPQRCGWRTPPGCTHAIGCASCRRTWRCAAAHFAAAAAAGKHAPSASCRLTAEPCVPGTSAAAAPSGASTPKPSSEPHEAGLRAAAAARCAAQRRSTPWTAHHAAQIGTLERKL